MTPRSLIGVMLSPLLAITGLRFSRRHRLNNTILYRLVDTVWANLFAEKLLGRF